MSRFQYKAKSGPGQAVEGFLEAESRLAALHQLSQKGYFPLSLEEYADLPTARKRPFFHRVSRRDLSLFTRQLADLLESGVPLLKALSLVQGQTANPYGSRLSQEILDDVRGGKHLSEALKGHPLIFSPLYVSLIYAGEAGGNLSLTLGRLADFMEEEEDFRSRVQAALAYPLLIVLVGMGTILFLMVFAVPRLAAMFVDLGQGMPFLTRLLTRVSAWMVSYGGWLILVFPVGGFLLRSRDTAQAAQKLWGRALLRIPLWGSVIQKSLIARFARTLATLLAGGVPILEALRVVSGVMDHPILKGRVLEVARQVEQGRSLSESLQQAPGFPAFICHMIAVGEEVNAVEKSLNKVAAAYERETDRAMKLAASLLEPCMILLIGSVVGVLVVAMLLPIFQISAFVK